jgi:hypothetical protein
MRNILTILFLLEFLGVDGQAVIPIRNIDDGKWVYIDSFTEKVVSEFKYDHASTFNEGMAQVNRNGRWGYINKKGKEVIECKYIDANKFVNGLAVVGTGDFEISNSGIRTQPNRRYGMIDKLGNVVIKFEFESLYNFENSLAKAKNTNGNWGWINRQGYWQISPLFIEIESFNKEGIAKVRLPSIDYYFGKSGFINTDGEYIIFPKYQELGTYNNQLIWARFNHKYGFINNKGEEIIPFKYNDFYQIKEDLIYVRIDNKCGYIDSKGVIKVPVKYDFLSYEHSGYIWAGLDGRYGVIDQEDRIVTQFKYEFIVEIEKKEAKKGSMLVMQSGYWGLADYKGNLILPIVYDAIDILDSMTYVAVKGENNYYFDNNGNSLVKSIQQDFTLNPDKIKLQGFDFERKSNADDYKVDSLKSTFKVHYEDSHVRILKIDNSLFLENQLRFDSIKAVNPILRYWPRNFNYYSCYKNNKIYLWVIKRDDYNYSDNYKIISSEFIATDYDIIHNIMPNEKYLRVGKRGKFGISSYDAKNLNTIVPLIYEDVEIIKDSIFFIKNNGKWGIFDLHQNHQVSPFQFEKIKYLGRTSWAVCKNDKWALFDEYNLTISTSFFYDDIKGGGHNDWCLGYLIKDKWGLLSFDGEELTRPNFTEIISLPEHSNNGRGTFKINRQLFQRYFYKFSLATSLGVLKKRTNQ